MEKNGRRFCSKRTRHLDIRNFYVKDVVERGEAEIAYCPTEAMLADFFTKPLQGNLLKKFRAVILGYVHVSSMCQFNPSESKERVEAHNPGTEPATSTEHQDTS